MTDVIISILLVLVGLIVGIVIMFIVNLIRKNSATNKADKILDDVDKKVHAFDGVFEVFETVSNKFSILGDKIIGFISSGFEKIFSKKKKKEEIESEED